MHLKEDGDGGGSVVLVREEKEREELDKLKFCSSYWVKMNYLYLYKIEGILKELL